MSIFLTELESSMPLRQSVKLSTEPDIYGLSRLISKSLYMPFTPYSFANFQHGWVYADLEYVEQFGILNDYKYLVATKEQEELFKNNNKLVSVSNLVSYSEEGQSPFLARYNRQKAVTISARLVGDYSLDEALKFLVSVVEKNIPQAKIAYKGESEEYKKTNNELYIIFVLALVTAYLAMCAQFESWRHPLTIMLTVPMAILGGILGLLVVGSSLNVYSQIALVILIGLSAKNGILIVEFANQLRKEGKNFEIAIIEASTIRLRPILMTSLSTIFGVLPLIIGSGPGAASRLTVGITIFGGMLFSTFFTLYVIPTVYSIIGRNTKRIDAIEIELNKQLKR